MVRNCKRCKKLLSEFYMGDTCMKCKQKLKNKKNDGKNKQI